MVMYLGTAVICWLPFILFIWRYCDCLNAILHKVRVGPPDEQK
jgi:hypothetical protein